MATASFTHRDLTAAALADVLRSAGFDVDEPRPARITPVDTFDGRLHSEGLRLLWDGNQLTLLADGSVPASIAVAAIPRFVTDLPAGPFRSRLAGIVDVRALLPLATSTTIDTTAVQRDANHKSVARVVIHELTGADRDRTSLVVEVDELSGHPKPAERARELLLGAGCLATDTDLVATVLLLAGVDPAGTRSSPTVPLDTSLPAAAGFRAVLANLRDAIEANWSGTVDDTDPEFLHDLRVAVRRTRSVLANAKEVLPADLLADFRDEFGWLGEVTGPPRDLDVYVIEWPGYVAPLPTAARQALDPVLRHLESRRSAAHRALVDALRSDRARGLLAAWDDWLDTAPRTEDSSAPLSQRPLGDVVRKRLRKAQSTLVQQGRRIDADSPAEQLHELRKDAKRLRYLLECFGGVLDPAATKEFVKRLKGLQENLGDHQDAEVHAHELRLMSHEMAGEPGRTETLLALGALSERLEQAKSDARSEFTHRFAAFDSDAAHRSFRRLLEGLGE